MNDITLKITIDGKEANAVINLTDDNVKALYQSFKYGETTIGSFTTAISRGFNNAREIIGGVKETFATLSGIFSDTLTRYHEYELTLAKIKGIIESNGAAAGYTAAEIDKMAVAYSKATMFSKLDILAAEQVLLTYKNIGHDALPQATEAVMGLATAMNTDMASAARTLGMVLENPEEGMRRLRTLGIVFDAEQKDHLKTVQSQMGIEAAQSVILEILAQKFGAVNKNIQATDDFKINQLEKSIGKMKTTAGGMEAAIVSPFVELGRKLTEINPTIGGSIVMLAQFGAAFATLRVTGLMPALSSMSVFGNSLTSLTGLLTTGGIVAGVAVLTWGLNKLADAYQNAQSKEEGFQKAHELWEKINSQNIAGMKNASELQKEIEIQTSTLQEAQRKKDEAYNNSEFFKQYPDMKGKKSYQEISDAQFEKRPGSWLLYDLPQVMNTINVYDQQITTAQNAIKQAQQKLDKLNQDIKGGKTVADKIAQMETEQANAYAKWQNAPENSAEEKATKAAYEKISAELENYKSTKSSKPKGVYSIIRNQLEELKEQQRHELEMLKSQGATEEEIYQNRLLQYDDYIHKLIELGQDTTGSENSRAELVAQHAADEAKKKSDARDHDLLIASDQYGGHGSGRENEMSQAVGTFASPDEQQKELESLTTNNIADSYEREKMTTDIEYAANLERYKNYENFADLKTQLDEKHKNTVEEIEEQKTNNIMSSYASMFSSVAGMFGKQTALYKIMAAASITMEGIKAAQAALSPPPVGLGPVFGIPLAIATGVTTAINLAKLAAVKGYAKGTTSVVGEYGPEIIAPLDDYASGQANLVKAVLNSVDYHLQNQAVQSSQFSFANLENIMSNKLGQFTEAIKNIDVRIDNMALALLVRKGNDLLTAREI
jgi:hypothetical protein